MKLIKCPECGSTHLNKHTGTGRSIRRACQSCAHVFTVKPKRNRKMKVTRFPDDIGESEAIACRSVMFVCQTVDGKQYMDEAFLTPDNLVVKIENDNPVNLGDLKAYVPAKGRVIDVEIDEKSIVLIANMKGEK